MINVNYIIVVILVFTRISAMFMLLPVFGTKNIPNIVKIGFIFFVSLIVIPVNITKIDVNLSSFMDLFYYILMEFLVGFSIGLISTVIMNVFYIAGAMADRNIGFSMVSVVGAEDEKELPVSANLYYIMALMIFLLMDMHHYLLKTVIKSYELIPIGSNYAVRLVLYDIVDVLKYTFVTGFKMAAPFIITVLIANLLLGLLSKAMPGLNVFMVGMPLKILVGLLLLYVLVESYINFIPNVFDEMMKYINQLLGMSG